MKVFKVSGINVSGNMFFCRSRKYEMNERRDFSLILIDWERISVMKREDLWSASFYESKLSDPHPWNIQFTQFPLTHPCNLIFPKLCINIIALQKKVLLLFAVCSIYIVVNQFDHKILKSLYWSVAFFLEKFIVVEPNKTYWNFQLYFGTHKFSYTV